MSKIDQNTIFYHIYPLGACGAPRENDFHSAPIRRILKINGWLDHIQSLGANAIYLGPIFESSTHGYDTANYYEIDRRLGTRADLAAVSQSIHSRGMSLVLDGVFNHIGRDFWAFKDVLEKGQASAFTDWFAGLRFDQRSPYNDPFSYEAWNGHFGLVKLNLSNQAVKEHLFEAVRMWKEEFQIDGIRLDAADALSFEFMNELRAFCDHIDPNLWLMGEVIHGDYRNWANSETLHSTTNYELYKALYSSLNDHNFFELAHSLNREFGGEGIYRELPTLYNFVDNHDVARIKTQLKDSSHLNPLHILLFTIPGLPSIYYGSEFGFEGIKQSDDWNLRPGFDLSQLFQIQELDLINLIAKLSTLHKDYKALTGGGYKQKLIASDQFVFQRSLGDQHILVAVNSSHQEAQVSFDMPAMIGWRFVDLLNPDQYFVVSSQGKMILDLDPVWGRVLVNA